MGLLDKLTTGGSNLSKYNGGPGVVNAGATKQSKLHADGSKPSYSLNGINFPNVNAAYIGYDDNTPNQLPQPSELDINGITPATALRDAQTPSINNSFSKGTYKNGAPEGRTF
jgi:hypothetical protein